MNFKNNNTLIHSDSLIYDLSGNQEENDYKTEYDYDRIEPTISDTYFEE